MRLQVTAAELERENVLEIKSDFMAASMGLPILLKNCFLKAYISLIAAIGRARIRLEARMAPLGLKSMRTAPANLSVAAQMVPVRRRRLRLPVTSAFLVSRQSLKNTVPESRAGLSARLTMRVTVGSWFS